MTLAENLRYLADYVEDLEAINNELTGDEEEGLEDGIISTLNMISVASDDIERLLKRYMIF